MLRLTSLCAHAEVRVNTLWFTTPEDSSLVMSPLSLDTSGAVRFFAVRRPRSGYPAAWAKACDVSALQDNGIREKNTQLIETQENIALRFCSETDRDVSLWETEDNVFWRIRISRWFVFWKGSELFSKWLPVNRDVCCAPLRRGLFTDWKCHYSFTQQERRSKNDSKLMGGKKMPWQSSLTGATY